MHHVQSSIDVSCHKADVDCIYIYIGCRERNQCMCDEEDLFSLTLGL